MLIETEVKPQCATSENQSSCSTKRKLNLAGVSKADAVSCQSLWRLTDTPRVTQGLMPDWLEPLRLSPFAFQWCSVGLFPAP